MNKDMKRLKRTLSAVLLLALALSFAGCVLKSDKPTDKQIKQSIDELLASDKSLLNGSEEYTYEIVNETLGDKNYTNEIVISASLQRSVLKLSIKQSWDRAENFWLLMADEAGNTTVQVLNRPTEEEIKTALEGNEDYKAFAAKYTDKDITVTLKSTSWEDGSESCTAEITVEIASISSKAVTCPAELTLEWNREDETWVVVNVSIDESEANTPAPTPTPTPTPTQSPAITPKVDATVKTPKPSETKKPQATPTPTSNWQSANTGDDDDDDSDSGSKYKHSYHVSYSSSCTVPTVSGSDDYVAGYKDGYSEGYSAIYDAAYDVGYDDGFYGTNTGATVNIATPSGSADYSRGFTDGVNAAGGRAHSAGYTAGYNDGSNDK